MALYKWHFDCMGDCKGLARFSSPMTFRLTVRLLRPRLPEIIRFRLH